MIKIVFSGVLFLFTTILAQTASAEQRTPLLTVERATFTRNQQFDESTSGPCVPGLIFIPIPGFGYQCIFPPEDQGMASKLPNKIQVKQQKLSEKQRMQINEGLLRQYPSIKRQENHFPG